MVYTVTLIHVSGNVDELSAVVARHTESRFRTNLLSNPLRIPQLPEFLLLIAMHQPNPPCLLQMLLALEVERESASAIPVFQIQMWHLLRLHDTKPTFNPLCQEFTTAPLALLQVPQAALYLQQPTTRAMDIVHVI